MRSRPFNMRLRSGRWFTTALQTSTSTNHIRLRISASLLRIISTILLLPIMATTRELSRVHIRLPRNLAPNSLLRPYKDQNLRRLRKLLNSLLKLLNPVRTRLFRCLLQGPLRTRS